MFSSFMVMHPQPLISYFQFSYLWQCQPLLSHCISCCCFSSGSASSVSLISLCLISVPQFCFALVFQAILDVGQLIYSRAFQHQPAPHYYPVFLSNPGCLSTVCPMDTPVQLSQQESCSFLRTSFYPFAPSFKAFRQDVKCGCVLHATHGNTESEHQEFSFLFKILTDVPTHVFQAKKCFYPSYWFGRRETESCFNGNVKSWSQGENSTPARFSLAHTLQLPKNRPCLEKAACCLALPTSFSRCLLWCLCLATGLGQGVGLWIFWV